VLFGLVRGALLVSAEWIQASLAAKRLLPPDAYLSPLFRPLGAGTRTAAAQEAGSEVFQGLSFYIAGDTKMPKDVLGKLLRGASAKVNRALRPGSVCVACTSWGSAVPLDVRQKGVAVISEEWIFDCIVQREVQGLHECAPSVLLPLAT
jgi:hypothetical protein